MKRMALLAACLVAAAGAGYRTHPEQFRRHAAAAAGAARWAWEGVRANPVPASLAVGTFLLTVLYHKARGKSLRESVEVAATRVKVVAVPAGDDENRVLRRAKVRATRTQLLTDQLVLQDRQRKLPGEVLKAEKDACYTEQAVADAERKLADRRKAHDAAVARLEALRKERAEGAAELAEIEVELEKLAELV